MKPTQKKRQARSSDNKSRRKSHLPGYCPGADGNKETASHNHPTPSSIRWGGRPRSIYFCHGFSSFFFFSKLLQQPSYDLGRVCCPVISCWHSRLVQSATWNMGYWPSKTKNQDIVVFYCHIQDSFSLGENDYYFPVKYDYSLTVNTGLVQRPLVILGTSPPSSFFNNRSSQLLAKSMTTVWIPYLEGRCGNMVSSRLKGYEQNNTCHFGFLSSKAKALS